MNIMTALKETELLWKHLAKSGGDDKSVAAYKIAMPQITGYANKCPCCEFTIDSMGFKDCRRCPIWDDGDYCWEIGAEYNMWTWASDKKGRKTYAKLIANKAKENYNLLKSLGYSLT